MIASLYEAVVTSTKILIFNHNDYTIIYVCLIYTVIFQLYRSIDIYISRSTLPIPYLPLFFISRSVLYYSYSSKRSNFIYSVPREIYIYIYIHIIYIHRNIKMQREKSQSNADIWTIGGNRKRKCSQNKFYRSKNPAHRSRSFAKCQKCVSSLVDGACTCALGNSTKRIRSRRNEGGNYDPPERQPTIIGGTQPGEFHWIKQRHETLRLAKLERPSYRFQRSRNACSLPGTLTIKRFEPTACLNLARSVDRFYDQFTIPFDKSTGLDSRPDVWPCFIRRLAGSGRGGHRLPAKHSTGYRYSKGTRYFDQCQSLNVTARDFCHEQTSNSHRIRPVPCPRSIRIDSINRVPPCCSMIRVQLPSKEQRCTAGKERVSRLWFRSFDDFTAGFQS